MCVRLERNKRDGEERLDGDDSKVRARARTTIPLRRADPRKETTVIEGKRLYEQQSRLCRIWRKRSHRKERKGQVELGSKAIVNVMILALHRSRRLVYIRTLSVYQCRGIERTGS